MALSFQWDEEKAALNVSKHGVTFDEASTVFADPLAVIFDDAEHSQDEIREIIIGHSILARLLLVSTERGEDLSGSSARGKRRRKSEKIMKKAAGRKATRSASDELRDEYRFDYSKAKPNRFASQVEKERLVVALDPDVSEVFTTPEAVNRALRAFIEAMPTTRP